MLKDKVCIITGTANGIGRAHAKRFAAEGAIVISADLDDVGAKVTADDIVNNGGRAFAYQVDISDQVSTDALAKEVKEAHGRIDVLLNNAGIFRGIQLLDTTPEYLDTIMQVNLYGTWKMSGSVVPYMIEDGGGKIINQSSDAAYVYGAHPMVTKALPNFSYGLSKWGVNGLTKYMANVLGQHSITVNCISPGIIMTESTKEVMGDEMIDGMVSTVVPMRRRVEPEDVAAVAVFFASADSNLVTGQILCVDGGMCMPG